MLRKAIVSFPHRKKSFVHLLNRMIVIDIRTVGRHPEKRSENKVCGDSNAFASFYQSQLQN